MWKLAGISMLVLFSIIAYFYRLTTTNKTILPKPNHHDYSYTNKTILRKPNHHDYSYTNKTMLRKPNHHGYNHGLEIVDISDTKPSANLSSPSSVVSSSSGLSLSSGSFFIDHDEKVSELSKWKLSILKSFSIVLIKGYLLQHELTIDLPAGLFPSTVITIDDSASTSTVEAAIKHFHSVDDVFHTQFLEIVILVQSEPGNIDPSSPIYQYLVTLGVKRLAFLDRGLASRKAILDGPYFSSREGLHLVWKLWPDTQGAFLASLVQMRSQQ